MSSGGKGGNPSGDISNIAGLQTGFAKQILAGQMPPAFTSAIDTQYQQSANQAMDLIPRGGQLNSALTNIGNARAQEISSLPAQLLPIAMGGLGQAESAYSGLAQSQNQAKSGLGAGTGQLAGQLGSAAIMGSKLAAV